MSEPLAYWNGNFLLLSEIHLPINDAGFVWGATVTDLCRTFRHQLFRLDAHLIRFRQSCELARIPQPRGDDELAFIAQELVRHNSQLIPPENDLALVMFATPGAIGYYLGQPGGPGDGPPTLCMHTFPLPFQRYVSLIQRGARLVIPSVRHVAAQSVSPLIKHRSRLHWWIAEQQVHDTDPSASALLLNQAGRATETPAANFLFIRNGQVISPARDSVLGGISLQLVEELCRELEIPFREHEIVRESMTTVRQFHLPHLEEAMICGTPYCLAPVSAISGRAVPWPGPIFQQLIAAWNRKVGLDIWGQICSMAEKDKATDERR